MKDLTEYLKKAFEFKNNGDYKKSIDYFYKALALDNESAEIMTELAILYSKLCQYDRAISFYEQIISLNPENFSVQLQYAMLLKTIKEYKHSEEILLNLYDKEYELEKVSVELFHLLFINNNFEKIVLYYNKCSNKLNNSIIFYYVASAYSQMGRKDIAEEFYKKSFKTDEKNILSGINVAKFLYEEGHINESENLCLKLLKLTESDEVLYLLGEIAYIKNDIDSAIKYYSYAIKINPQNAMYYFKLAIVFSLKGFFKEAEESYCKAIVIEPENTVYNYALAYMYYMNNKMDLSERLVDYILSLEPENSQALSLKALLLINRNEVILAGNLIDEINMKNDDFSYYVKAIYYSKLNVWEKAIENILKAIRLNGESIEYKYQLATYNYIIENYKKTIEICAEINSKNPKYIQSYILLAKVYIRKEDIENAQQNINKALILDKNIPEIYCILAELCLMKKEYDRAIENYKIAVSMNPKSELYYAKIAECYYMLENYKDAYVYYKEACEFDISNADYRYYMAKCSINNNDEENALSNFSIMKRLAPANIKYITEYADYVASKGKINRAVSILNSLVKELNNTEEKEKVKKYIKNLKKGS